METRCRLCDTEGLIFSKYDGREYYNCPVCKSIFMNPRDYVTSEAEEERYKEHNNDVYDSRYQEFVAPIVRAVQGDYRPDSIGLDYGCGTGPVISKLLRDDGYELNLFDPFFANYPENLKIKYNYIVSCEVIEHFHSPKEEFHKLHSLLKPGGAIFLKTELYNEEIDFGNWNYKNDQTHVFFYQKETLEWIRKHYEFADLVIEEKYIKLRKKQA